MRIAALSLLVALIAVPPGTADELAAARRRAGELGRPLVASFSTRWCGWCRRMDRETMADLAVSRRLAAEFVVIALDAEVGRGRELATSLRVRSFPTIVVLAPDGIELGRVVGFRKPEEFLLELSEFVDAGDEVEAFLERDDQDDEPQVLLDTAMTLERAGRRQEAAARYRALLWQDSPAANALRDLALIGLAKVYLKLDEPEMALECYRTLVRDFPDGRRLEQILEETGRLELRLHDLESARTTYGRLLEMFPNGRHAGRARRQLELLAATGGSIDDEDEP